MECLFRCPYGSDQGFPLDGTKFHLDGPKALPLESARTLAGPGPRFANVRSRKTELGKKSASTPLKDSYCFNKQNI